MKKVNLSKPGLMVLTGLLIACFTFPVQGKSHDGDRNSDRYYYSGSNYNGYSSHDRYSQRERYSRERDYYYHKSQRQIRKEIKRNEKRIRKLESKIRKLHRKGYYSRHYYRRNDYRLRIRQWEWEISSLERRNRYLRRHLTW
jgi:hypothetical protein